MTLNWIDLSIIIAYFAGILGVGIYFSRRNKGTDEYFAAGRSHGGWVLGLSLVGASISSVTFIALPADTFLTAWYRFIPTLMLPVAILFTGLYFVPLYRQARITSAYEYLEARFGPNVRMYAAAMFAIGMLIRLSIVLFLLSVVVHAITGLDPNLCIVIAGVLTGIYTLVGGLNAVIWTDAIQTVVLIGGGIVILWIVLRAIPGGVSEVISTAVADNKLSFADMVGGQLQPTQWSPDLYHKSVTMMLLYGVVGWLTSYITDQGTVQRYIAAKSSAAARKSIWICATMSIPIWAGFMFVGTALYVYYLHFPDTVATQILDGTRKAEEVLPHFLVSKTPVGVAGIVVAGIMAAAMSTLSSCMNAFASVMVVDLYRRKLVTDRDDRHYLKAGWIFTGLGAVIMVLGALALLHAHTETINSFIILMGAIASAGMLSIFLLGFLTTHASTRSVGLGIAFTIVFNIWCVLSGQQFSILPEAWKFQFELYYSGILGNVLMFVIGYGVSYLLPADRSPQANLTIWNRRHQLEHSTSAADTSCLTPHGATPPGVKS